MSENAKDTRPLRFGKHVGKTPEQIAEEDPSYIKWAFESLKVKPCSRTLYLACVDKVTEADALQDETDANDEEMRKL